MLDRFKILIKRCKMKDLHELKAYKIHEKQTIEELKAEAYLVEHVKTGARIAIISCDDENKVFSIGFRTPPKNSKGIPHILEHSVLCGSKKYPAKGTFVELIKGSMNTFLNAMTFPDKTVYPVASCNDSDFKNLMSVYIDAVFRTNIYEREEIFLQEGWNYQLNSVDSPLMYNGVVYNEMKGAFSSPETLLNQENMRSLFPNTPYGHVSGGDPDAITDLSYDELLSFHSRYYHPSNSYIYLYGNMDAAERLIWLDENYLSKYDRVNIDSEIPLEAPFNSIAESTLYYPIGDDESEKDNTFLSYNTVIGEAKDNELSIAFDILNYAILEVPGAALKQAILDKCIAKTVSGYYNSSIQQPIFSIIAKKSNKENKDCFFDKIIYTLKELVKNGIDKDTLMASINMFEFKYKEADFGRMPKGLVYGFQAYRSWLYNDNPPFECFKFNKIFESLRKKVHEGYFESLIEKYIINNSHSSLVQVIPQKGLMAKKEKVKKEKLDLYKKGLSGEEIIMLVDNTHKLKKYQESPSKREDLDAIPMLSIEDINPKSQPLHCNVYKSEGTDIVHHNIFTNGIGYLKLSFDVKKIPSDLIPYLGMLNQVLSAVDTEKYSCLQLSNIINMNTGGISAYINLYSNSTERDGFKAAYEINIKVLYEKLDFVFEIIDEIIRTSKIDSGKKLYEIISDIKTHLQMWFQGSGNMPAVTRSLSYNSAISYYEEVVNGLSFYHFIEDIERNFDSRKELIAEKLETLIKYVFRPEKLTVSYTSEEKGYKGFEEKVIKLKGKLYTDKIEEEAFKFIPERLNEGFKTSSAVQYAAQSGNFNKEFSYTGALKVLKVLLSYDYLWLNVREKGGAYGCMLDFKRNGNVYVVSYRDPNLSRTYDVYEHIPEFLKNLNLEEKDIVRYIIGAIKELDMPMTPYAMGARSFSCYMSGITEEDIQKERNEIIETTKEKLTSLSPLVETVLKQKNICAIGNEEKIESEKQLFSTVKQLFS
jgi:Zn-dependent M16 (insulinase) family peptidase